VSEIPPCSFLADCEQAQQHAVFGCPQPEGQVVSVKGKHWAWDTNISGNRSFKILSLNIFQNKSINLILVLLKTCLCLNVSGCMGCCHSMKVAKILLSVNISYVAKRQHTLIRGWLQLCF